MAMLLLLLPSEARPQLDAQAVSELAQLGVSRLAFVRNEAAPGLVVECGALDPTRSSGPIATAILGSRSEVRAFRPFIDMTLTGGAQ